jgi:hypothetical protein
MKPELPREIRELLPREIVGIIRSFVPHISKSNPPSPGLQRELERLQRSPLKGKNEMYLKGLSDFILK